MFILMTLCKRCHGEWGQLREEVRRAEGDPTMARQDVEKVIRMMQMMKAMMAMRQIMTMMMRATQLGCGEGGKNMGLTGRGIYR